MARLESQAKGGYFPTPPQVAELIAGALRSKRRNAEPNRGARFLDPCCGEGTALHQIAAAARSGDHAPAVHTYGIELNHQRAETAQQKLDHTLSADLFAASIANNAFSFMLLNPPYDNETPDPDEGGKRTELAFLQRCTNYLIPGGGIIAFIIPANRLKSCARYLAAHYFGLQYLPFPPDEARRFNQITIAGYRRTHPRANSGDERMLLDWADRPPDDNRPDPMTLEAVANPGEILFTSLFFDPQTIADEAAANGLWTSRAFTGAIDPPEDERKLPLMPLRKGHVALLTAAGFLDNMVLEAPENHQRILVKGRAVKKRILKEDTEEKQVWTEVIHTSINTMDLATGQIRHITT